MSDRWLLLRRHGLLWAVPSRAVRGVRRHGEGAAIAVGDSTWLQADELLEMTAALLPRRWPECLGDREGSGVSALAVWEGAPVAVLGAGVSPPSLVAAELDESGTEPGAVGAPAGEP